MLNDPDNIIIIIKQTRYRFYQKLSDNIYGFDFIILLSVFYIAKFIIHKKSNFFLYLC